MAFDPTSPADTAALSDRRERVRAWSLRIAGAVEAIPMPQSYRDGERAARAITVADRMLVKLPEPNESGDVAVWVTPARQRLRRHGFLIQPFSPKLKKERAGRKTRSFCYAKAN